MKYSLFLLAVTAGTILAQEHGNVIFNRVGPGPVGIEAMMGGTIKGQPYSADVTTAMVQVLPDGNRITNQQKSFVARDSQGRTRNEAVIQVLGAPTAGEAPVKIIMIHDPLNKITYTLETVSKTARKISLGDSPDLAKGEKMIAEFHATAGVPATAEGRATFERYVPAEGHGTAGVAAPISHGEAGMVVSAHRIAPNSSKMESLGSRMIEGVMADGTRSTDTIPAGEIGNDKEILITNEVWTAQDLKAVVLSKRVDPRMGEMTYQLSNIQRSEPAASLFEVPSDYKVLEGPTKDVLMFKHKE